MKNTNFFSKLKKGQHKYKAKLHFKCFSYGRIGHYANKFPYKEKSLISKEDNSEGDESEDGTDEALFMAFEDLEVNRTTGDSKTKRVRKK